MAPNNHIFLLPFPIARPLQIQGAFRLIKTFESREGVVELVSSKRNPGKLRIVKSVKHTDRHRPPAEARALSRRLLANGGYHPNIIEMYTTEMSPNGFALMLFEYCTGGDLFTQLQSRRATPLFALHILISIAEALAFLHHLMVYERGNYRRISHSEPLVHSDIKDDNVFLRFPGTTTDGGLPDVVLADFGLSNLESHTKPGWGCVPFMSPECRTGSASRLTHKTDIYSFGVMMESVLNHSGNGFWPLWKNPRDLIIDRSYQDLGFTDVLRKCLVVRAADRGDFSSTRSGMLANLLKFRDKRSAMLRNGEMIKKSYWVAKI
jgi:serine/threonine protein kinase